MILSLAAKIDIIEISEWYDVQTPRTGERFLKLLDEKFEMIEKHPLIYCTFKNSEIRKCKLDQWPYHVFFAYGGELIEVVAVIHTSRDPNYILSRIHP